MNAHTRTHTHRLAHAFVKTYTLKNKTKRGVWGGGRGGGSIETIKYITQVGKSSCLILRIQISAQNDVNNTRTTQAHGKLPRPR